jgi:propanediol dehydratase large subunit
MVGLKREHMLCGLPFLGALINFINFRFHLVQQTPGTLRRAWQTKMRDRSVRAAFAANGAHLADVVYLTPAEL